MSIKRVIAASCLWIFLCVPWLAEAATLVFVNRCAEDCQFSPGPDSAVENTTTVLGSSRTLSAFEAGDAVFNEAVECISDLLAPFDITVTTSDPSPALHTELALAGTPQQFLLPDGVTGIAPFNCSLISNAPAFVFANLLGSDAEQICYTAASQLGALAGIEPLHNCLDVTSYLPDCGPRTFRNEDSMCGTFSVAPCICGGTTRNSFSMMRTSFGPAELTFSDGFETSQ